MVATTMFLSDTGTATPVYDCEIDAGTMVEDGYLTIEDIPIDRCCEDVFYLAPRKKRFLCHGVVEVCEVWRVEDTYREYWRLLYTRVLKGERRFSLCDRKVDIVRRSKNRGRHWDRKSA